MNQESSPPAIPARHVQRLSALLADGKRKILGIVGAPGAGKSSFAQALHLAFPDISQIVPMDGFHLANTELARLGRPQRKGAPDTFDSAGYDALLRRLRRQGADEMIYAPEFRRDIDEAIAGAIPVFPHSQLIITEGNYLLLQQDHWQDVAALLDQCWYLDVDDALRTERLLRRHERYGRTPREALDWVAATDAPNAQLIKATRARADLVLDWDGG
ncbi:pantothenate kinase [Oxalobacteraceae bacterium GrIS 1.11]